MPSEVSDGPRATKSGGYSPERSSVLGSLGVCLVEGDSEQRMRERRVKRRSLVISVSVQLAALAAMILIPLFGKPERIALAAYVPIPPYSPYKQAPRQTPTDPRPTPTPRPCVVCFNHLSPRPSTTDGLRPNIEQATGPSDFAGLTAGPPNQIPLGDSRATQPPPPPPGPRIVHVTHLDPATLIRRVEPVYPFLAKSIRKEGRVELHAVIAIDGSIQSLQFAGGDAMFFESARDAVLQWCYRPTVLNGQPVEVDTTITVIYTLNH